MAAEMSAIRMGARRTEYQRVEFMSHAQLEDSIDYSQTVIQYKSMADCYV